MAVESTKEMPATDFAFSEKTDERVDELVRFLDALHQLPGVRANHKRTIELLGIDDGFHLLDLGCGVGSYSHDVFPLVGVNGRVVGLDQSPAFIDIARRRAREFGMPIEYVVGDVQAIPFPDDTFDGCRIERVLQYVDDPRVAISEMMRVTKPGGRIVASEVDWDNTVCDLPGLDRGIWRRANDAISDGSGNGWMGRELRRLFLDAGVERVHCEGIMAIIDDACLLLDDLGGRMEFERSGDARANNAEDTARLLAHIDEAARKDRFFWAMSMFTVSGQAPLTG
jgi:ubiquinone/menaquinone biosynthesis C-methylase UbiE